MCADQPADGAPDLARLIEMQIGAAGPISIATYMELCAQHPRQGYYTAGRPLGLKGDFITAPEISQMFGELIGLWVASLWEQIGQPGFTLLELGPGRGTLMQDALRVATRAEGFADALHLQLFETNAALKAEQAQRLGPYLPYWADQVDAVGDGPLIVVANEFFDALPIRQFVRGEEGWHERQIGLREGNLAFGLSPLAIGNDAMPAEVRSARPGEIYEVNLAAVDIMQRLGAIIRRQGGALLVIDYGYDRTQTGETLQAVRGHAFADPLQAPGETDISAHVDFAALARAAASAGLNVAPLATQGEFLGRLGIAERATRLARANPSQTDEIAQALRRLVAPEEMGTLFKAFCAMSRNADGSSFDPPGFRR